MTRTIVSPPGRLNMPEWREVWASREIFFRFGQKDILVTTTKSFDPNTGAETISGSLLNFNAIWAQQESIAIAPSPSMAIAAMGIFAGMSDVSGVSYTVQGSYQLQIPQGALLPNSTVSIPAPPNLPVTTRHAGGTPRARCPGTEWTGRDHRDQGRSECGRYYHAPPDEPRPPMRRRPSSRPVRSSGSTWWKP